LYALERIPEESCRTSATHRIGNDRLFLATQNPRYRELMTRLERYARHDDVTVLFEGETGTGKTILARYMHDCSPRAANTFREVPLSGLDDGLANSDLFGHIAGAFTDAKMARRGHFASAAGGTLFLDEIGKATLAVQKKLLVAIERHEVWPVGADRPVPLNLRIVAASNVSLERLVERGQFLPDLYARLAGFRLVVTPLRERRVDIPALALFLLERRAKAMGYATAPDISISLQSALQAAEWTHNIRGLDAVIHHLLVIADGARVLEIAHCQGDLEFLRTLGKNDCGHGGQAQPLQIPGESKSAAARRLGIARTTLYRRLGFDSEASA
jgi:DNA-binding NtrC family response regulator